MAVSAPAFAASTTDIFRFNIVGRQNGQVSFNVTNLTGAPITVRVVFPFNEPESNLTSVSTPPDWAVTFANNGFVITATIPPTRTSGTAGATWVLTAGNGNYTLTASSGTQTTPVTLAYAASAARQTKPQPLTGTVTHRAPGA
jgi:hypothetical protein